MMKHVLILGILLACIIGPACAQAGDPQDQTKAVIIHYSMKGDVLSVINSKIIYGYPPNNLGHDAMAVNVLSRDNTLLKKFGIEDPRIVYYDGGSQVLDSVDFSITTPFYPSMTSVDVYSVDAYNRTQGALLSHTDLTGTVSAFCSSHPQDKDCSGTGISGILPILAIVAVIIVIAALAGWYIIKKRKPQEK